MGALMKTFNGTMVRATAPSAIFDLGPLSTAGHAVVGAGTHVHLATSRGWPDWQAPGSTPVHSVVRAGYPLSPHAGVPGTLGRRVDIGQV